MPNDLVEKVARAIYAAGCLEPPERKEPWQIMEPEAKAAIAVVLQEQLKFPDWADGGMYSDVIDWKDDVRCFARENGVSLDGMA